MNEIDIELFELDNGKTPFLEWERKLDRTSRNIIRIRINRIRLGNFGDCKTISGSRGLYELRIHLGPGYRIYFAKQKETLIILLSGGSKKTKSVI